MNNKKLVDFFYILLRDKILFGDLEDILVNSLSIKNKETIIYSNKHLESYARDIVKRLNDPNE